MSDLVGNPEDRFSHNEAHIASLLLDVITIPSPYIGKHLAYTFNQDRNPRLVTKESSSNREWLLPVNWL